MIGELERTPEMMRAYIIGCDRKALVLNVLREECELGRLSIERLDLAATQFWGLVLTPLYWPVLLGLRAPPEKEERDIAVEAAVAAFLARYKNVCIPPGG